MRKARGKSQGLATIDWDMGNMPPCPAKYRWSHRIRATTGNPSFPGWAYVVPEHLSDTKFTAVRAKAVYVVRLGLDFYRAGLFGLQDEYDLEGALEDLPEMVATLLAICRLELLE